MPSVPRQGWPRQNYARRGEAPNIAGQKYDYLVHSLMAYKAGERKSPMMSLAVKSLSDEDMANVAAYYAAIKITVEVPH